jgi:breast cancer 2 susceptibility protein
LLNIAGNSTKLARWDARLGRQDEPFVAGLSSLSVDGGIISLMDVVIDKLFPVAYTAAEKGRGDAPWGEEEERQRQDAWSVS